MRINYWGNPPGKEFCRKRARDMLLLVVSLLMGVGSPAGRRGFDFGALLSAAEASPEELGPVLGSPV